MRRPTREWFRGWGIRLRSSLWLVPAIMTAGGILLALAREHGGLVRMECGIGDFVVRGTPIVSVSGAAPPPPRLAKHLERAFTVAPYRTVDQDVVFGVREMVDVALKALSPGINDTSTAVSAVDNLSAVLARVAARRPEPRVRDVSCEPRVIARGPTSVSLLDTGLDQIRRNAAGNASVLERILTAIATIGAFTRSPRRRLEQRRHVDRVRETARRGIGDPVDLAGLEARADALARELSR